MMEARKTTVKRLIRAVCFICIAVFLLASVSYLLRAHAWDYALTEQEYKQQPENSLDVVFIGASAFANYWAPLLAWRDYGFTSFSYAGSSMPSFFQIIMAKEIAKKQSPSLWVFDMRTFRYDRVYSAFDVRCFTDEMEYGPRRYEAIRHAGKYADLSKDELYMHFDLGFYHTRWKEVSKISFTGAAGTWKGFSPSGRHESVSLPDYSDVTQTMELGEQQQRVLLELLDYCRDNHMNALFLNTPSPSTKEMKMAGNRIREIVREYGYEYLDGNDYYAEMNLIGSTDFYDPGHVNVLGAEKFTLFLADYLTSHYSLPTTHEEEWAASWDESLAAFETTMAENKEEVQERINIDNAQ